MRWILLRGLTREAGHWGRFPHELERRSGQPVVCLDLPGNGASWDDRSPASVACMASELRARAGEAPGVLLAMSLGAMVALEWCRQSSAGIRGCVLVNTSASGTSPFWHRLQPRSYAPLASMVLPGVSAGARERAVLALTSARAAEHERIGVLREWQALAARHPVSRMNALRQLWAAARYRAPAQRPALPVLLLASRGDRLVSPQCSRALAGRWGLPLREHPWAGHDLPLDDPDWVVEQALHWALTQLP